MNTKKLAREIAAIISTHDNKDQYGNAKLAEYIIRKVRTSINLNDVNSRGTTAGITINLENVLCPLCQCNHPEMTCEEFANMPVFVKEREE